MLNHYYENLLKIKLQEKYGDNEEKLEGFLSRFKHAARTLKIDLYEGITIAVPYLTKHDVRHVYDVLKYALLILEPQGCPINAIDLYVLYMTILFHDAGNVFGREDHHKNILEVYRYVFPDNQFIQQEYNLIKRIVEAHCGSIDGDRDTLKRVERTAYLHGDPVLARDIAAILRFADELSEGPNRTSTFMTRHFKYPENSEVHHKYASITEIAAHTLRGLISIDYNINICSDSKVSFDNDCIISLKELLDYTYKRLIKLNEERRYTQFYCKLLEAFKEISANFNFHMNNTPLEINLEPILIDDLILPGDTKDGIEIVYPEYIVDMLIDQISSCLKVEAKTYD